jgi:uncharacterized protein (DUF433 family)
MLVDPEAMHEAIAGALGISVEDFEAARAEGTPLNELAEELGVDLADVQAAVQAVHEEALLQALEDGTITQEQYDAITGRFGEAGPGPFWGPGRGFGGGPRRGLPGDRFGRGPGPGAGPLAVDQEAMHEAIAGALGISVDDLEAAIDEGTSPIELAEELGVDVADIQAAVQVVHEEALITQEQYETITGRLGEAGPGRFGAPRGGFPGGRFGRGPGPGAGPLAVDQEAMHEAIAGALGVSVEDLEAAIDEGTSPVELAEELGVDVADIQAAVQAVHEEALLQALEDGTITQEQYDAITGRFGEDGPGRFFGPGRGFDGPCSGFGGGPRGNFGGRFGGNGWQGAPELPTSQA